MTFIPTQTVQNAFEVCGGYLSCLGQETSRNSLPGSSLLDIADWEAYEAARQNMMPRLLLSSPAPRYGVLALNPIGGRQMCDFDNNFDNNNNNDRRRFSGAAIVTMGVIATAIALYAVAAMAQTARDIRGPSPLLTIENEPPAKLIVDPPLPGPLAFGRVFIQYRTENLRILPVFGKGALDVSPRVGHLHITVDDAPWHFADGSGETVILVGLLPGPHKVLFELADPTHKVITSKTIEFTVPDPKVVRHQ